MRMSVELRCLMCINLKLVTDNFSSASKGKYSVILMRPKLKVSSTVSCCNFVYGTVQNN